MKKIMKIGALSLALIASLLLLSSDKTNAATAAGRVSFVISGATNTQCTYGTSWDMGTYTASLSAFTASGTLSNFVCTDTEATQPSWSMTIQATSAVNTNGGTTPILATGVFMQATPNTRTNGSCATGTNTTTLTEIGSTPGTIMIKGSAINQVCQITTTGVTLKVNVPAAASVGAYSGSLQLTVPR